MNYPIEMWRGQERVVIWCADTHKAALADGLTEEKGQALPAIPYGVFAGGVAVDAFEVLNIAPATAQAEEVPQPRKRRG